MRNSKGMSMLAFALAAAAMSNDVHSVQGWANHMRKDPAWKRKKCKSCVSCGSLCDGRWSKPNQNACERYEKRK